MDKPKNARGQASVELMVMFGVLFTIFIVVGFIVVRSYSKSADLKVYVAGQRVANHVADNINTINAIEDGHNTYFEIPKKLTGFRNYTMNFFKDENSVFIQGSAFSTGNALTYSAPITTTNIHCTLPNCKGICNTTYGSQCLFVNESMKIKIGKLFGKIYLTPEDGITHEEYKSDVTAFVSYDEPNISLRDPIVLERSGEKTATVYVKRTLGQEAMYLIVCANLSVGETLNYELTRTLGSIQELSSDDPGEITETAEGASITFDNDLGTYELDKAIIKFGGGFHTCLVPNTMTYASDIHLIDAKDQTVTLNPIEPVCISYP